MAINSEVTQIKLSRINQGVDGGEGGVFQKDQYHAAGSPTLDLNYGGLTGAMPRFGYYDKDSRQYYGEWINATPYVRQNIIPVMLTYPAALDLFPTEKRRRWVGMFKAAMEVEAQSISGLNTSRSVESGDGGKITGGQTFEVPTKTTIATSSISYTWKERMGRSFGKWLDFWIEYLIMDPFTGRALITKYLGSTPAEQNQAFIDNLWLYTPDFYTVTMLYIEPSNQMTTVEQAWLAFNMWPKTGGNREGRREVDAAGETIDITTEFANIVMDTDAVKKLAQAILPRLESLYEIPDLDLTLPVGAESLDNMAKNVFKATLGEEKQTAHSSDTKQGNSEALRFDTHPTGLGDSVKI